MEHINSIQNVTLFHDAEGNEFVNFEMDVFNDLRQISLFVIRMDRCRVEVTPSTCEYFGRWSWATSLCTLLRLKGMIWTPSVSAFQPEAKCPMYAGHYKIRNGTTDLQQASALTGTVEGHVWSVEFQLYNQDREPFMCAVIGAEVMRVRKREY